MGWTTFHETRTAKEYFTDMIKRCEGVELVDIAIVNFQTAYLAVKDLKLGYTYCAVYMLHRAPKSYHNFGYKDMTEFSGPCVDDCPLRIINKLTPLDEIQKLDPEVGESSLEWAKGWRQRVVDNANKRKSVGGGKVFKLKEPMSFINGDSYQYFKKEGRKVYAIKHFGTELEREVRVRIGNINKLEFEII